MIVQCPECRTKFKLADEKVTPKGVKIRCSSCKHVFVVHKEGEVPPAAPAAPASTQTGFSVDDFGTGADSSDVFSDSDFTDGPLGQTRPPEPGAARPDRPKRPGPGEAPPPRPPVKPATQDNVFNIDDVDFSVGRKMEVDLGADAPAPSAPAAPPSAPTAPFAHEKGEFDNLDELFGPKKGGAAAPPPPPAAPAPQAPPPPPPAPARSGDTDPFGDAMTLDTSAKAAPSAPPASSGDPFGDLFDSGNAPASAPSGNDSSAESMLTEESDMASSGLETEAEAPSPEPGTGTGEEFDTLISGTDDFFGGGGGDAGESFDEGEGAPPHSRSEPALQWGNQKKMQNVAPPSALPKVIGAVVLLLVLICGWRASVEYMPQLYLDSGMEYEEVVALRGIIPFPANPDFPPPPKFWDLTVSKSFTIVNQFGKELYVVEGEVKNIGTRSRSFFQLEGQALSATNKEIGLQETVFAGNILDVEALKRLPIPQVRAKLQVKIGGGGINFAVKPGASVPFMMVFPELAEKAANVHIIQVQADLAEQ
ncbi:MAG: zinc-ribbon domain-containing protein [Chrysiogenetes bacterium]|nr:zinc-ribbon domain-containing protein [Chrysiogenetes bacterium]